VTSARGLARQKEEMTPAGAGHDEMIAVAGSIEATALIMRRRRVIEAQRGHFVIRAQPTG